MKLWQTVLLLVVGYSGFYLCRSSFSVAKPLLLESFKHLDKSSLGAMASVGTLLYAIGKLIHGPIADKFGGKPMFLYGMFGAILFSFMFGLGGPPLFTLAWAGNRFVQSSGWGGMIRIVSQWSPQQVYGRVMAFVSLSYLFGDFFSRLLLGYWVSIGMTWSGLFVWSAVGLLLISVPVLLFLQEHPTQPIAAAEQEAAEAPPEQNLLRRADFWAVCALSFCFTLLRETFNEWTPTLLHEFAKLTKGHAGQASSIFPLFGALSVLLTGVWSDRLRANSTPLRRLSVLPWGLGLGAVALAALGWIGGLPQFMIVALVGAVAFFLIGPYSLLAGATSLDFGGSKKSATAAGWVDGVGYFGGIVSGMGVGALAQNAGWSTAMLSLSAFCAVVSISLVVVLRQQR